jgi:hypothetical protein
MSNRAYHPPPDSANRPHAACHGKRRGGEISLLVDPSPRERRVHQERGDDMRLWGRIGCVRVLCAPQCGGVRVTGTITHHCNASLAAHTMQAVAPTSTMAMMLRGTPVVTSTATLPRTAAAARVVRTQVRDNHAPLCTTRPSWKHRGLKGALPPVPCAPVIGAAQGAHLAHHQIPTWLAARGGASRVGCQCWTACGQGLLIIHASAEVVSA